MAGELTPAWVLHRRAYGDNGFLLELLTLEFGRISAVARGVRRKARGGTVSGLAQPFMPLLVAFGGRGELQSLRQVEAAGAAPTLMGQRLLSGLYANELILRLLPRFDPMPDLFAMYSQAINDLASGELEQVLRPFELQLLADIGYSLALDSDCFGDSLRAQRHYVLDPERGLVMAEHDAGEGLILGAQLKKLSESRRLGEILDGPSRRLLKKLTRLALAHRLGPRPLRSRALAQSFVAVDKPQAVNFLNVINTKDSGDLKC